VLCTSIQRMISRCLSRVSACSLVRVIIRNGLWVSIWDFISSVVLAVPAPHGLRLTSSFSCLDPSRPSLNAIDVITRSLLSRFFRHSLLLRSRCEVESVSLVFVVTDSALANSALGVKCYHQNSCGGNMDDGYLFSHK